MSISVIHLANDTEKVIIASVDTWTTNSTCLPKTIQIIFTFLEFSWKNDVFTSQKCHGRKSIHVSYWFPEILTMHTSLIKFMAIILRHSRYVYLWSTQKVTSDLKVSSKS